MSDHMSRKDLKPHVADYFLNRILALLPKEVAEAINSLSEDQIDGLRTVGEAMDASVEEGASEIIYMIGHH